MRGHAPSDPPILTNMYITHSKYSYGPIIHPYIVTRWLRCAPDGPRSTRRDHSKTSALATVASNERVHYRRAADGCAAAWTPQPRWQWWPRGRCGSTVR